MVRVQLQVPTGLQIKQAERHTEANSGESMFMKDGKVEVDKLRTLTRRLALNRIATEFPVRRQKGVSDSIWSPVVEP